MGIIFDIQKFCVQDGPGIRTTVFLKGCNIRCLWCHNPESFCLTPQLSFDSNKCILCGRCVTSCPKHVHVIQKKGDKYTHSIDYNKCILCGNCVSECPCTALKIIGKEMSVSEVINEVLKDRIYYNESGGGVTFSGGEPSTQFDFLMQLLLASKRNGLNTCVETNGIMSHERFIQLMDNVDLILLDYKATGDNNYIKLTGASNGEMLSNLNQAWLYHKPVIMRCPIIPGINDSEEHFAAIRNFKKQYDNIIRCEIMPYHTFGVGKWKQINADYSLGDVSAASNQQKILWNKKIDQ